MRVRVRSFDNACGEYVGFQFVMVPGGMGLDPSGRLVQGPPQPSPMLLIAFKDQFVWGPVQDMIPEWSNEAQVDNVPTPPPPSEEERLAQLEELVAETETLGETESADKVIINTAESAGV